MIVIVAALTGWVVLAVLLGVPLGRTLRHCERAGEQRWPDLPVTGPRSLPSTHPSVLPSVDPRVDPGAGPLAVDDALVPLSEA